MNKEPTVEEQQVTVVATHLKLRSYLQLGRFFKVKRKVERQLQATPGLIGHWLDADYLRLRFSTLSVWKDDCAVDSFARTAVFDEITTGDDSGFVRWKTADPQETTWEEADTRLVGILG